MSKQIQKKGPSKKPEEKKETEKLNAFVQSVRGDNTIKLFQEGKKKQPILKLAYVLVPRFDKEKKKHEVYDYECHEYLRKTLCCGKRIGFDVIHKNETFFTVVPYVKKEDIVLTLLQKGYAYLTQEGQKIQKYSEAFNLAKEKEIGMHNKNASSLASRPPEELYYNEAKIKSFIEKKQTIKGYIYRCIAPAVFVIETEERKQIEVSLYGVDQYLRSDRGKYILDEDGYAAIEHISKQYNQRDCTVQIVGGNVNKIFGFIKVENKDIGEDLLKNGFVICRKNIDYSEEVRQKYTEAEKEAKKNHAARWTDFDQAEEDRIIAEKQKRQQEIDDRIKNAPIIKGEVVHIGRVIKVKAGEKEFRINIASVTPIRMGDEKENDLLQFRIKEVLRVALVGKKNVEFKEAYKLTKENKKTNEQVTDVFYDIYAGKKNVAFTLLEKGLVNVVKSQNIFKRSFDYEEMLKIKKNEYKSKEIQFFKDAKMKKFESKQYQCLVERVYSPIRFLVYIPSEDCRLIVNLEHCRIPRVEEADKEQLEKFIEEATKDVKGLFGINTVDLEITRVVKKEEKKEEKREPAYNAYCEISTKKYDLIKYVLKKGYVMPYGDNINVDVSELRENGEGIYQFSSKRRDQKDEKKPKEKPRKEKVKELVFGEGKKVHIVGFDGLSIYYFEQASDAEFLKDLSQQLRALPKGPIEMKENNMCIIEIKGTQYRGKILSVAKGANIVQCIDTGVICVCGKGKLKPITEELAKKEFAKPKSIALCGIKSLPKDHQLYKVMMEEISQFYGKEATIYENKLGEDKVSAKVIVGDVCINVYLLRQGLSTLDKFFNDQSEWGNSMFQAQEEAHKEFLNIYKYGEYEDEEEKKH